TKPGSTTQVPAIGMDFFPTMLELAGLPPMPQQHVDGVSLVPVLKGGTLPDRDLFWHYPHYGNQGGEPSSIIRSKDWKLIFYHEDGRYELYNLADDIGEQSDLAAQHPEKVAELKKRLDAWLADTGAVMPERDPRFTQAKFDAKLESARTKKQDSLEKQHARYLEPGWKPNANWWGSSAQD
uniref:sulfatase/phosphatase domain-containing protein n=1 Tax=Pontiella sp. TaxID=2837462 RepID=UPI003568EB14